jgi:hypothetical protein
LPVAPPSRGRSRHRAQHPTPVIGFLSSLAPRDLILIMPAFHEGLNEIGFVEGRNIMIPPRMDRRGTLADLQIKERLEKGAGEDVLAYLAGSAILAPEVRGTGSGP